MVHLRENGFDVEAIDVSATELAEIKAENGIANELAGCHTAFIDGLFVEGHVPASDIERMLAERPPVKGIAVPGMPAGSPGMEGPRSDPYNVIAVGVDGSISVFQKH